MRTSLIALLLVSATAHAVPFDITVVLPNRRTFTHDFSGKEISIPLPDLSWVCFARKGKDVPLEITCSRPDEYVSMPVLCASGDSDVHALVLNRKGRETRIIVRCSRPKK